MSGRFAVVCTMALICLASGTGSNGVASVLARSEFAARGASKDRKAEPGLRTEIEAAARPAAAA